MNVLSLFDGMSCGQIALKQLGIIPEVYYASEVDKHAIKQTQLNFPNTIQLGDVTRVDVSQLEPIDLLIGGSPCQSFSFAGKRVGMSTTDKEEIYTLNRYLELKEEGFQFEGESYLFWEYMRILNDIRKYNPDVKFLLENVEMGNKWERVLSEAIGVFGVHINSALVSAQNRKRIYWTNIRTKEVGLFGEIHADIPQPEDKGILLRDILESEVDEKYYFSDKIINTLSTRSKEYKFNVLPFDGDKKSGCLRKDIAKMGTTDTYIRVDKQGTTKANHSDMDLVCVAARGNNKGNVFEDKTPTLSANSWEQNNLLMQYGCDYRIDEGLRIRINGKSGSLLARARSDESCGQMVIQLNQSTESGGKQPYQQNRVYADYGKSPAILAEMSCGSHAVKESQSIRRLTPTECSRLQTVPDWYKWECSDTQQYKMLGNGWTVDVIVHILSFIKEKLNINVA